ncbi:MAG: Rrf2 family transcriptional regulator [Planctomycetes bacterium]|nr:Rrf2 family transcriptional regulator [Planctomycetota bacterium]
MDILRRNTDYALRLMVGLARHQANGGSLSTRLLAAEQEVSYQLACKLMQQLHEAKLVASAMGPKGGFRLNRSPARISLLDIIEVVQGPLSLNRCLSQAGACPRAKVCPMRGRIGVLQDRMGEYLAGITLEELASERRATGTTGERV